MRMDLIEGLNNGPITVTAIAEFFCCSPDKVRRAVMKTQVESHRAGFVRVFDLEGARIIIAEIQSVDGRRKAGDS